MEREKLIQEAQALSGELTEMRRHLHRHPELGLDTKNTAAFVFDKLTEYGYRPQYIGTNSVTATVGNGGGKVFLLRADMDALQMPEESGLPFASVEPDKAHCCGHDLHTAMLLGAAKLLKAHEAELEGTVKLLFQAGEENMQGGRDVLNAGILKNPDVDAAMAIHVNSIVPCGRLLVFTGAATASSDLFTIHIKGRGCHGSRPDEGIDPLNAAAHIHIALQELQARELAAGETGVLTIGCMQGGTTFNVIPDEAKLMGTIRTYNNEVRENLRQRLQDIVHHTAAAFRAEATVEFSDNYTVPLVCNPELSKQTLTALKALYPGDEVRPMPKSFPGSEDFAFIANEVPSVFVVLGANAVPGTKFGQHHPKVQFNEDCLPIGAAAHTQAAIEWLKHNR